MAILSRILYGDGYEHHLDFGHGLADLVTDREPSADAEFDISPAGVLGTSIPRWDYTAQFTARWMPYAPSVDGAYVGQVQQWLDWCREGAPFRIVPNVTLYPDFFVDQCYLVTPVRGHGGQDPMFRRSATFKVRSTGQLDFAMAFYRHLFFHVQGGSRFLTDSRGSVAQQLVGSPPRYIQRATDELCLGHQAYGQSGILIDRQQTNQLLKSSDIDSALSEWTAVGAWTEANAVNLLQASGVQARKVTNDNAAADRRFQQTIGTLTGNAESLMLIIENVDASVSDLGLWDSTTGSWVHRAELTWSSGAWATVAGSGELFTPELLANAGPNGGKVYRLTMGATGTAANGRRFIVYPTGVGQNGLSAILHHAQLVENEVCHSVIVTDTVATQRSQDFASLAFPWRPQPMWVYAKFVDVGSGEAFNAPVVALQASSTTRLMLLSHASTERQWRFFHESPAGQSSSSQTSGAGAHGDTVELLGLLSSTGSAQLLWSLNGGTVTTESAGAARAYADNWADAAIFFGVTNAAGGSPGSIVLVDAKAGPGVTVNTMALARSA